ncbi:hypothetical protein AURDEDRAFT_181799 [Auricularia subglabra TFB-10046 SS5]|nr:hypothetical protein AURDEDRAFT_181799 [Auricularia subglabra TFB-10046 SS5]
MRCAVCPEPGTKLCSSCKSVRYCSAKCQKAHWAEHRFTCRPDKISSSDRLVHAVLKNAMPTHPEVLLAFGFMEINKLDGGRDLRDLIQFWRHVVDDRKVTAKMIESWRKRQAISASVLHAVSEGPWTAERVFWHNWIAMRHERLWPKADYSWENPPRGHMDVLRATFDFIRTRTPSLSHEDFEGFLEQNLGTRRMMSFMLYRCLCATMAPMPSDMLYLPFGFVTCPFEKQSYEIELAYKRLVDVCTFYEFDEALQSSGLFALLSRHDLTKLLPRPLELEDVLSHSPDSFKDVWHLKRHIDHTACPDEQSSTAHMYTPDVSALARFGFAGADVEEAKFLERIYRSVLVNHSARPLELQAAMERGEIFAYLAELEYYKIAKGDRARLRRLTVKITA